MAAPLKKGFIYHTATFNGREHTATPTEWGRIIDCPMCQIERGLPKHGSMQALIDAEFAKQQQRQALFRLFCMGVRAHGC